MNKTYFFKDKPLFGLDIGFSSLKVMQLHQSSDKMYTVDGYGYANFDPTAIVNGVIVEPELIAKVINELFDKNVVGEITTRRVAMAVSTARTFTRTMQLPKLDAKDLTEAVKLEAEQYIPVPIDDLYLDYSVVGETEKEISLLAVAVPKKIIDSYMTLSKLLNLEIVALETTIAASTRLFVHAESSDLPTVLVDFGSVSADITIYDKTIIVTGTVQGGGDRYTDLIARSLRIKRPEAQVIKTKYGLGVSKKQRQITEGVQPLLDQLLREIRRMIRYYEDRNDNEKKIGQIVTMGGGANMPGLTEYLTNRLRMPVRMCDPWQNMDFAGLQKPNNSEKPLYATVAGSALLHPKEVFA